MRAKICGLRSGADVAVAVAAGADAVGFLCGLTHHSEDALDPDVARDLAALVPPYVNRVLVTQLTEAEEILALAEHLAVDTIQLHGLVDQQAAEAVQAEWYGRLVRVVHVSDDLRAALDQAREAAQFCDALLLDSRSSDRLGGTGQVHEWSISAQIVAEVEVPCILAGGLAPENLAQAIDQVRPYAVDVNSGVEDQAGTKDENRVREFIRLAHAA